MIDNNIDEEAVMTLPDALPQFAFKKADLAHFNNAEREKNVAFEEDEQEEAGEEHAFKNRNIVPNHLVRIILFALKALQHQPK